MNKDQIGLLPFHVTARCTRNPTTPFSLSSTAPHCTIYIHKNTLQHISTPPGELSFRIFLCCFRIPLVICLFLYHHLCFPIYRSLVVSLNIAFLVKSFSLSHSISISFSFSLSFPLYHPHYLSLSLSLSPTGRKPHRPPFSPAPFLLLVRMVN